MKDLFGVEISDTPPSSRMGPIQRIKHDLRYRPADNKQVRCKTCKRIHRSEIESGKRFYKCPLIGFSGSEATDIRVNHVCKRWEVAE